jgi:hypothetical protein
MPEGQISEGQYFFIPAAGEEGDFFTQAAGFFSLS